MSKNQICAERLYQTADKAELVREGDERAAFLFASPGDEIPASAAEVYGIEDGKLAAKAAKKPKVAPETKPAAAAETKA
jgi:hypothetical protein